MTARFCMESAITHLVPKPKCREWVNERNGKGCMCEATAHKRHEQMVTILEIPQCGERVC
jgi:hypothetical protein